MSHNELILWSLEEKKPLMKSERYIISIFSDDETICVTSFDNELQVWNLLEKQQGAVFRGHIAEIKSVAITRDNLFVVSGSTDKTVRVWNILEKRQKVMIKQTFSVLCIGISRDGKFLVIGSGSGSGKDGSSSENTVRVWNLKKKRQIAVFEGHNSFIISVKITSDNQFLVSDSFDFTVRVWSLIDKNINLLFIQHFIYLLKVLLVSLEIKFTLALDMGFIL